MESDPKFYGHQNLGVRPAMRRAVEDNAMGES